MAKRLEIRYSKTTSASIDGPYLSNMRGHYMSVYGRLMGGSLESLGVSTLYKFNGVKVQKRTLQKTKKKEAAVKTKTPDIDISRLVILGGTFEKVGEENEAIGGGTQKVGTGV